MNTTFSALVLASVVAVSAHLVPAAAGEASTVANLKPRQGVSLEVGTKRAVGYFLADSRLCNLTLLVADRLEDGAPAIPGAATRLQFEVAAGADVKVETGTGKALVFGCATNAASMSVRVLSQVAAYEVRR